MEAVNEKIKEIIDEVILVQDTDVTPLLSIEELKSKVDHLNQLLEAISAKAQEIKEKTASDQHDKIDQEVKRVKLICNGSFHYLDTLIKVKTASKSIATETSDATEPSDSTEKATPTGIEKKILSEILRNVQNEVSKMLLEKPNENSMEDPIPGTSHSQGTNVPLADEHDERSDTPVIKRPRINTKPTLQLKFDKITITTFSGQLTDWIAFRDQYTDLVHLNPNLTEITKFYQLQTHLSGAALEVVNGFKMSAVDYEPAWQALLQRYDNRMLIIFEYIKLFLELPNLPPRPDRVKFLAMVDKTKQMLRVLPRFNINVSTWDPIIMYCLQSKLNPYTHKKWMDQVKRRQDVPLSEFIEFLEIEGAEAPASVNSNASTSQNQPFKSANRQQNRRPMVLTTTVFDNKCSLCKNEHPIYRCSTFLALKISDRIAKARLLKLCLKCLMKHPKGECNPKFGNCKTCGGTHNNLLCHKRMQAAVVSPQQAATA